MRLRFALFLIAYFSGVTPTFAQISSKTPAEPPCVAASGVGLAHLLGLWRAEFAGVAQSATVLLEKSREFAEGLAGGINRNGLQSQLAGDVDNGEFTLDESDDGINIAATWAGKVTDASCGREIRGLWTSSTGGQRAFVLRKASGW